MYYVTALRSGFTSLECSKDRQHDAHFTSVGKSKAGPGYIEEEQSPISAYLFVLSKHPGNASSDKPLLTVLFCLKAPPMTKQYHRDPLYTFCYVSCGLDLETRGYYNGIFCCHYTCRTPRRFYHN